MASKHLWIAELQDRDGNAVEYHSLELEPEHYASRADFNRAMTSWSAFRQRERGNLKSNRPKNSRCKWACHWMTPDDITFYLDGLPTMPLHKTIWDLYDAIGYNYKAKKYERETKIIAIDPGSECNMVETTFDGGIPVKVRQITSNHGCTSIVQDPGLLVMSEDPKRMRGHNPHIAHLDESGYMNEDGKPIYTATGNGKTEFLVQVDGGQEFVALADAPPSAPEVQEEVVHEVEYPAIKNPFNGVNVTEAQARAIADKVNAEPDINAKKRILKDQLQHFAAEREGTLEAEKLRNRISMPGDRKNDPKVVAHKRSVVKSYQKLKRQQAKAEKMKALQVKAFNGK